jgi:hypothetical protein
MVSGGRPYDREGETGLADAAGASQGQESDVQMAQQR